jgi:hypothetical protein
MSEYENNYPSMCIEVGLGCEECTASTARELARVCTGLRGKAVAQLFVQIYTDPACARMHAHFSAAYREASDEAPRKSTVLEIRHGIAAVA